MDKNIIKPSVSFDFMNLSLAQPTGIQGGSYFTKLLFNKTPIYIQTTNSLTKNGFIKNGKKIFCDLMFDNNSEELINWFEKLETKCHELIYEKSNDWFQGVLEINDIESAFNPIIKIYKSGKYYLVRTNVKINTLTNLPNIKIYDENENNVSMDDVTHDTNIISILEIQGIKFTNKNFQFEIELKQVMVLNNHTMFENCLIKNKNSNILYNNESCLENTNFTRNKSNNLIKDVTMTEETINKNENENAYVWENSKSDTTQPIDNNHLYDTSVPYINDVVNISNHEMDEVDTLTKLIDEHKNNNINLDLEIENLDVIDNNANNKELNEIDIVSTLENNLETITLKKPNEVYYKIYKEARIKAKQAKQIAVMAYLEAKNIKNKYMLDDLNESDIDSDGETY